MRLPQFAGTVLAAFVFASPAAAQEQYPSKLVRIVTPESGGNADIVARFISVGLSASFG